MNWRTRAEQTSNFLRARAAAWAQELAKELQAEWRSRPLIRHLGALALCLLVVLVGVLDISTKRASIATATNSVGRTVAEPQASPRGAAIAEGRLTALHRAEPAVDRK